MEGKEKTAERKAHFNQTCSTDKLKPINSQFLTGKCNSPVAEPSTSASFTLAAASGTNKQKREGRLMEKDRKKYLAVA